MSRKGNPYDNAACESFLKTLKYEQVHRQEYRDLAEARRSIQYFLERVYNEKRLHSALDYCPPVEFERNLRQPVAEALDEALHAFSQVCRNLLVRWDQNQNLGPPPVGRPRAQSQDATEGARPAHRPR